MVANSLVFDCINLRKVLVSKGRAEGRKFGRENNFESIFKGHPNFGVFRGVFLVRSREESQKPRDLKERERI